jgi:hypothetical protein
VNTIFSVLFAILSVSCVTGLIAQQMFLFRLRRLHHETWTHLGRPIGFLNTADFLRFIWRREYESLSNFDTVRRGRFLRAFMLFYFILVGFTMLIFVITKKSWS